MRDSAKTIAAVILFALTLVFAFASSAQQVEVNSMFSNNQIVDHNIAYFKVMKIDKNLFFKLLITEDKENTTYIIEASIDGENFTSCQIKEGFKSPENTPLLYCFSEKRNQTTATVYRIKRVSFDGIIAYSGILILDENTTDRKWISSINEDYNIALNEANPALINTGTITVASVD